jgi:hypothetical protein
MRQFILLAFPRHKAEAQSRLTIIRKICGFFFMTVCGIDCTRIDTCSCTFGPGGGGGVFPRTVGPKLVQCYLQIPSPFHQHGGNDATNDENILSTYLYSLHLYLLLSIHSAFESFAELLINHH